MFFTVENTGSLGYPKSTAAQLHCRSIGILNEFGKCQFKAIVVSFFDAKNRRCGNQQNLATNCFMGLKPFDWICCLSGFCLERPTTFWCGATLIAMICSVEIQTHQPHAVNNSECCWKDADSTGHLFPAMEDAHLNLSSWLGRLSDADV